MMGRLTIQLRRPPDRLTITRMNLGKLKLLLVPREMPLENLPNPVSFDAAALLGKMEQRPKFETWVRDRQCDVVVSR
jgi:hypothetical protein